MCAVAAGSWNAPRQSRSTYVGEKSRDCNSLVWPIRYVLRRKVRHNLKFQLFITDTVQILLHPLSYLTILYNIKNRTILLRQVDYSHVHLYSFAGPEGS